MFYGGSGAPGGNSQLQAATYDQSYGVSVMYVYKSDKGYERDLVGVLRFVHPNGFEVSLQATASYHYIFARCPTGHSNYVWSMDETSPS